MLIFALALRDKGVAVPDIAAKLTIKTGVNAGKQPSVTSVYRALADALARQCVQQADALVTAGVRSR
jgi:hypothetical protein